MKNKQKSIDIEKTCIKCIAMKKDMFKLEEKLDKMFLAQEVEMRKLKRVFKSKIQEEIDIAIKKISDKYKVSEKTIKKIL